MGESVAFRCVIAFAAFLLADSAAVSKTDAWAGNYVIVLPKALQPAAENTISVQIQSSNVALRIDSNATDGRKVVTGQVSIFPSGKGVVKYRIPFENYKGKSMQLIFTAFSCNGDVKSCAKSPGRQLFTTNVTLPVLLASVMIFTDISKPIFKPGEEIRFRLLPLSANSLKPVAGKKKPLVFDIIYVEAPNNMRLFQKKNVSWVDALRGMSYQLSSDPLFGVYKIVSKLGDVEDVETFKVKEYVLPKFTVSIKLPSYVFIGDSHVNFSVCAKYSTGRPMQALVSAELCVKPERKPRYGRYKIRPCIRSVKKMDGTKACVEFQVNTKVLDLRNKSMRYWGAKAFVNATVIENGTDATITKVGFGGSLERAPFKLVNKMPDTFMQGLPFYGQVQTVNHDGSRRPYEKVTCRVNTYFAMSWGFSQDYVSDANGIINFGIPPFPPEKSSVSIFCKSTWETSGSKSSNSLQINPPSFYHNVRQIFSPTKTFLQIYPLELQPPQQPCASGKLSVRLQSNTALHKKTIQGLSTARGGIQTVHSFEPTSAPTVKCQDQDSVELGHYKCVPQKDGSFKIRCLPGWKGDNCLTPICEEGCIRGVCRAPNTCTCKTGWVGTACNKCVPRKGCANGYCHYGNDCYCKKGYRGFLCTKKATKEYRTRPPVAIDTLEVKKEPKYDPETQLEELRFFSRSIDIPISPQLYPSSKIVLWFTHKSKNGSEEFVVTSITLKNLRDCLSKGVPTSFTFDKKTVRPGERVTASIKTAGSKPKCALAIFDIALETFGERGGISDAILAEEIGQAIDRMPRWPYPEPYRDMETDHCRESRPPVPVPRVRRMIMPYEPAMMDSSSFFKEAGTFVLSNIPVATAPCRERLLIYDDMEDTEAIAFSSAEVTRTSLTSKSKGTKKKIKARIRSFFPEAWMFELLEDSKSTLVLKVPDSMTTWIAMMYCVSSEGIGLSLLDRLVVFQPFFLYMSLPYSLVRGEIAKIPVKVFSYRKECSEISLTMKPSKQLKTNGPQQVTSCLCNFGQITAYFRVQPSELGEIPIEVEAVSRPSDRCPNPKGSRPITELADGVRRKMLIKPEGMPEEIPLGDLLCPAGKSATTTLEVTTPKKAGLRTSEGSERAYLMLSGNPMGSSLDNLGDMLRMPYGCGEQNMASMVPSIYVLGYLTNAGIQNKELMEKARKYISIGYQRELKYRLRDGSFSAFGERDKNGSTWLTAFVFKSFVAAKKYTEIDSQVLTSALKFLLSKAGPKGCFRENGRVFSSSLKGGQGSGKDEASITAYILGALLEANETDPSLKNATAPGIAAAVQCLNMTAPKNAKAMKNLTNYGVALRAYALTKWNASHNLTKQFREELQRRQIAKDGFKFWKANNEETVRKFARSWAYYVSADVETTAYALLTQLALMAKDGSSLLQVVPILRWLTSQRNERGGWYSTQDTVMALQALREFAQRTSGSGKGTDLSVTIESKEGKREMQVTNDNQLVLSKMPISVPNSVKVTAKGEGCLVVQANVLFNVLDTGRAGAPFSLWANTSQRADRCDRANVRVCVRYTGPSKQSGMAVVKVRMASGWQTTAKSIEALNEVVAEGGLKLIEVDPDKTLVLYFDSFAATNSCFVFDVQRDIEVTDVKPMLIQVYDYYKPHETQERSVQVVNKTCEKPKSDASTTAKCPLCTTANDKAAAASERLCAKPHFFAAVERQDDDGAMWRYTQRVGDVIMVWRAALKLPEGCKCDLTSRAMIAVHTRWWSLATDEDVTLDGDWTVINVESLAPEGHEKLKASCAVKSEGFTFGYDMFMRKKKEEERRKTEAKKDESKSKAKAGKGEQAIGGPQIEPPESMCFACSEHVDESLKKAIREEMAAKTLTIARVKETRDGKKVKWEVKDLEGKSYGSRDVNYRASCGSQCKFQSGKADDKDLLVISKKRWKMRLEKKDEVIVPDGSFFIGFYENMVKLFPELNKKENTSERK